MKNREILSAVAVTFSVGLIVAALIGALVLVGIRSEQERNKGTRQQRRNTKNEEQKKKQNNGMKSSTYLKVPPLGYQLIEQQWL